MSSPQQDTQSESSQNSRRPFTRDLTQDRHAIAVQSLTYYLMGPIRYFILLSILIFYVGIVLRFVATNIKTVTIVVSIVMFLVCVGCYILIKRLRKEQRKGDQELVMNRV